MRRSAVLAVCSTLALLLALPGAASASSISSLSLNPDSVRGGASSVGTVETAFADVVPTTVRLFSGDTSVATMPATDWARGLRIQPGEKLV